MCVPHKSFPARTKCDRVSDMAGGKFYNLGHDISMHKDYNSTTYYIACTNPFINGSFYSGLVKSYDWQGTLYCWENHGDSPEHLIIQGRITDIPEDLFNHVGTINRIEFPASMGYINNRAFKNTNMSTLTFPGRLGWVGIESFAVCVNLKTVTFQNGVEHIYDGAFSWCSALDDLSSI